MENTADQISYTLRHYATWIAIGFIILYAVVMWFSQTTFGSLAGGKWLPVVLIVLVSAGLFLTYVIHNPYPLIVLLAAGTYVGSMIAIVEDGMIPFSLFQLILIASFGVFLFHRLYTKNFEFRITGLELEWALFFTVITFSLLYTPDAFDGTVYFLRYLVLFAMMYMVMNVIHRSEEITYLVYALIAISTVLAGLGLYIMVSNPEGLIEGAVTEGARLDRETVFDMDPNRFAALFLLPISFVASVALSGWQPKYRFVAIVLLFVLTLGVLSTYSRSVMVAMAIMLVLIGVIYRQYHLFLWFAVFGVLAVIAIPELRFFAETVLLRIYDIFAGTADDSSRIRVLLGLAAVYMFFDTYMLGVGFRGFEHHFTNYFTTHESIGVVMPHNMFYKVGAELGIIGLALFLFIMWRVGYTAYQNIYTSESKLQKANSVALFAAFIAMLIFYQFYGGGLWDNNLWVIMALIITQQWLIQDHK